MPPGSVAECVAVEPLAVEVVQTMKIVRGELIVRDLSARDLIVGKPVMGAQPVAWAELVVSAELVVVSRECIVVGGEIGGRR